MDRERAGSVGSGLEKRKREKEDEEIFGKSKKTLRSPEIKKRMDEEMKGMMKGMVEEMKKMRMEMEETRRENKEWRELLERREKEWKKEREELTKRVERLEENMERKERREKKNNLMIKGIEIEGADLPKKMEEWMETNIGVKIKIKEAWTIRGRRMTGVKLEKWEDKMEVMKKKSKLKDMSEKIFIDNDLTKEERGTQKKIKEFVEEEKKKGKNIEMGYRKVKVDGQWKEWDGRRGGLKNRE